MYRQPSWHKCSVSTTFMTQMQCIDNLHDTSAVYRQPSWHRCSVLTTFMTQVQCIENLHDTNAVYRQPSWHKCSVSTTFMTQMHIFTPSIIGAFNLSIAFLKISAACKPTFTLKCMIKIAYTFMRWKKLSILKLILSKKDISSIRLGNLVSNLKFCKAYRCCYFPEICWTTERAF